MRDSVRPDILTIGTSDRLMRNLWDRVAAHGKLRLAHIVHPRYDRRSWGEGSNRSDIRFFRDDLRVEMPLPDGSLLSLLEGEGVPTIHNMIMSDRVVSCLHYGEALAYATFLARRLMELIRDLQPLAIIGDFDGLHASLGFAVAKQLNIPWFAMHFTALPAGQMAFCSNLCPASTVVLEPDRIAELRAAAPQILKDFEERNVQAAAYIPPDLLSPAFVVEQIPSQLRSLLRVLNRRKQRHYRKYTDYRNSYALSAMFGEAVRLRKNQLRLSPARLLGKPIAGRYAFFGLHLQPESSIDVFAHFFSNQPHVVELIARSLPPTHALLVKLHKSAVPNYARRQLEEFAKLPGVHLVSPYADTFECIKNADLVFSIQGTIGLEAALLGRPVIMFGDSPTKVFPSVTTIGKTIDLPQLVREKLAEKRPSRSAIVEAIAQFLTPFYPTSHNDWNLRPSDVEIDRYATMFGRLVRYTQPSNAARAN